MNKEKFSTKEASKTKSYEVKRDDTINQIFSEYGKNWEDVDSIKYKGKGKDKKNKIQEDSRKLWAGDIITFKESKKEKPEKKLNGLRRHEKRGWESQERESQTQDEKKMESVIAQLDIRGQSKPQVDPELTNHPELFIKLRKGPTGPDTADNTIPEGRITHLRRNPNRSKYYFSEGVPIKSKRHETGERKPTEKTPPKKKESAYTKEEISAAMRQSDNEAAGKKELTKAERKDVILFEIFKENNISKLHAEKLKPLLLPIVDKIKSVSVKQTQWGSYLCYITIEFKDNSKIMTLGKASMSFWHMSQYLEAWSRKFSPMSKKVEKNSRNRAFDDAIKEMKIKTGFSEKKHALNKNDTILGGA